MPIVDYPTELLTKVTNPYVYQIEDVKSNIMSDMEIETMAIRLVKGYNSQIKEYDLCGDCRKKFNAFMNGAD